MRTFAGQGTRLVTVIVDGNNHNLKVNGKRAKIQTEITNNIVTLKKCRDLTEKLTAAGHKPYKLEFLLSIYADDGDMDNPATCLLNKKATYSVKHDELTIWDNSTAVYTNTAGNICRDQAAIADCMGDCDI